LTGRHHEERKEQRTEERKVTLETQTLWAKTFATIAKPPKAYPGLVHPRDSEEEEEEEEEEEVVEEDEPTVVPPTHGQDRIIAPPALSLQQGAGRVNGTMAAWYEQRGRPVPGGIRAHAPQEPAHQPNMNMEVDDPPRFSPERFGVQIRSLSRSLSPLSPSPLPSLDLAMQELQIQSSTRRVSAAKASAPKQQGKGVAGKENVRIRMTRSQAGAKAWR